MKTWQQTKISPTPIIATLALAAALALGGAGGYAIRALSQSRDVDPVSTTETPVANIADVQGLGPVAAHNPGIGLRRSELKDSTPAANITDATGRLGPVGVHNPGIGLHKLEGEELP